MLINVIVRDLLQVSSRRPEVEGTERLERPGTRSNV